MHKAKVVLGIVVAVLVAGLGGWLWGISGTRVVDRALQASVLRGALLEARSSVLDARLELYSVNFGDASRHLEDARAQLRRAEEQLKSLGRQDDLKQLEPALTVSVRVRDFPPTNRRGGDTPALSVVHADARRF